MEVKINGIYKHFKGQLMKVIAIGTNTETMEDMVIYKHLNDNKIWIRPIEMFTSKVDKEKYPDVEQEYRFELQSIEE